MRSLRLRFALSILSSLFTGNSFLSLVGWLPLLTFFRHPRRRLAHGDLAGDHVGNQGEKRATSAPLTKFRPRNAENGSDVPGYQRES